MFDVVITGGRIVDGSGLPWHAGDVGIVGDRIAAIGRLDKAEAKTRIIADAKIVAPGFVDAHVHGDLELLSDLLHEPAIRQGVTAYIIGQDGVAMAPASPMTLAYMCRYTAGFSGGTELDDRLPRDRFLSVHDYLSLFDRRCALNVATLVPNGNVRMEIMGLKSRPAFSDEVQRMCRLVRDGMEQGAVGLSSGMDYIPSSYADKTELASLCKAIAPFGGVYVTHMWDYTPDGVLESMDDVFQIGREAGVPVHISHFNSQADRVLPKLDEARANGVDASYDLYCYLAGSSILAMIALPPEIQEGGVKATLERLHDSAMRDALRDGFAERESTLGSVRLSYVAAKEFAHHEGQTLFEAAEIAKRSLCDFVCDVLVASELAVGCVAPHENRVERDVQGLMRHPAMMAGSDGIFTGSRPHPRGYGCFARYLGHYVRTGVWTLEQAVRHLAYHAARRFGLKHRGLLQEGMYADVIVFDADAVTDHATYEDGKRPATGMEHVIVNGELVLRDGKRTSALPGRALRR